MLNELEKMEQLLNEEHEYFVELKNFLLKATIKLKGFAHEEECREPATSCPQECCNDQLRILSAVVWDISDTIEGATEVLNIVTQYVDYTDQRLDFVKKLAWTLRTIGNIFFFVSRARCHTDNFYAENYWFWNELQLLRDEYLGMRWRLDDLLVKHDLGFI